MTQSAELEDTERAAFEQRFEDLELMFEDWTGINEEGESRSVQSSGEPVVDAGKALGSFLAYTAQLATDLGMSAAELKQAVDEVYEGMEARDAAAENEEDEEDDDEEDDGVEAESEDLPS